MKISEFRQAVHLVYGSTYGDSLCQDLFLPAFGSSANEAISAGGNVQEVWESLLAETQQDPELAFVYRFDQRQLRALKDRLHS